MELSDYLLPIEGHNWSELLADWFWLLPEELTVWIVNRFGDVIYVVEDDSVHMLDIGAGTVTKLANSQDEFRTKFEQEDNADYWLLMSATNECVSACLMLQPGQCYGFKVAPVFDGKYTTDNIEVVDLAINYSRLGQIHQQIKNLPDGTRIRIVEEDRNLDA